jgi:methionyl-tRNA formyltransferase
VVWSVLEKKRALVISLIEAADPVDSGRIYAKFRAPLPKTTLWPDINAVLANLVVSCLNHVVRHPDRKPKPQRGKPSWYRRRTPEDSRLNPRASIASQFDLLRICDPDRFPAFFDLNGERYELIIRKAGGVA